MHDTSPGCVMSLCSDVYTALNAKCGILTVLPRFRLIMLSRRAKTNPSFATIRIWYMLVPDAIRARRDVEVINPVTAAFGSHLRLGENGTLDPLSVEGQDLIDLLHLNKNPA